MARGRNRLTAKTVEKQKQRGRLADGAGLWLNVTHNGSKAWVFRWTPRGGKPREMGLGPYPTISLAKARERADECRRQAADGLDPKAERDRDIGKTFGDVADEYFEVMQSRWTNAKSVYQWRRTLKETAAPIRPRLIADIETADVLKILQPIWLTKPETARRVRSRLENVIDYATAKHWRTGENPVRWKGHLANILPPPPKHLRRNHPAMPYEEVPAFMTRLEGIDALAARALEITILTACRTGEVLQARWTEFDLDAALWEIPKSRMKAREPHRVPLSPRTVEILARLSDSRWSDFVFPGQKPRRPLSNMAMEMLLRRMRIEGVTVHGFRSTFRDWAGDKTNAAREIAEAALAHKVGNVVERSYRRGDALEKRRQLMDAWADFCRSTEPANVIEFRAGGKAR